MEGPFSPRGPCRHPAGRRRAGQQLRASEGPLQATPSGSPSYLLLHFPQNQPPPTQLLLRKLKVEEAALGRLQTPLRPESCEASSKTVYFLSLTASSVKWVHRTCPMGRP